MSLSFPPDSPSASGIAATSSAPLSSYGLSEEQTRLLEAAIAQAASAAQAQAEAEALEEEEDEENGDGEENVETGAESGGALTADVEATVEEEEVDDDDDMVEEDIPAMSGAAT
ncbi:hypothetical protein PUNSTDRAFT_139554 [Punctularia strigosozonata HHB-11173 SS5]|uniref:Uncharacterized protein n=1 Tax=Punctularia strigosozonata (strain HHB-11173) TaxID=741275 RepID=R7RZ98_PUNST|nr:uncharacterized protein PUNSTDRAFT_139554 [Punctularia strigosozonata HHB-11173 SS5]EIN03445.1 hypothetical protein PUNSTDRAFT_139554 [Punctularia strigosozonata HHB-11173 SS5]